MPALTSWKQFKQSKGELDQTHEWIPIEEFMDPERGSPENGGSESLQNYYEQ